MSAAEEQDDESPLSGRLAESSRDQHHQPGESPAGDQEDEDVPDWLAFAAFAKWVESGSVSAVDV